MTEAADTFADGVDVVIVSCNSGALLEDCVARVLTAEGCTSLRLYDNASSDGWPQKVAARFADDARFQWTPGGRNIGFGAACNRAAAGGKARWILFLNPDCLVDSTSLRMLCAIAAADGRIGLLGADVRDALGREEPAARRFDPTPARLLHDHLPLRRRSGAGVHQARGSDALQRVDACSGALMFMPRTVFAEVGGFDEDYFLHGEDLDLCARVRAAGHDVVVANEVRVVHRQGSSSRSRPVFVAWHKHLGLGRFLARHQVHSLPGRVLLAIGIGAAFLLRGLPKAWLSRGAS